MSCHDDINTRWSGFGGIEYTNVCNPSLSVFSGMQDKLATRLWSKLSED